MLRSGLEDMSQAYEDGLVVAVNGCRHSDALLAELGHQTQLSPRCAALCVFTLSVLSWAIVLVPLWALIQ